MDKVALILLLNLVVIAVVTPLQAASPGLIRETVTDLQAAYEVDVVVVGGSTAAVSCALKALGSTSGWNVISKSDWLRRGILAVGGEIWFCSFGCGVVKEGERIRGVVAATPQGRGVVLARTVIDSASDGGNAKGRYGIAALDRIAPWQGGRDRRRAMACGPGVVAAAGPGDV